MKPSKVVAWIIHSTLIWMLGALLVGGLIELLRSGLAAYRIEVPLVLALGVGVLNVSGNIFALALVRLFRG